MESYCFNNIISIPLITNQIFQFLDKDEAKCLSLCNKKIYQIYCKQVKNLKITSLYNKKIYKNCCNRVKNLKINEEADIPNLQLFFDKYKTIINLDLSYCKNIKNFTPISKLETLECLDISNTNISDISFLVKNKNIRKLNLKGCDKIKDFNPITNIEALECLDFVIQIFLIFLS